MIECVCNAVSTKDLINKIKDAPPLPGEDQEDLIFHYVQDRLGVAERCDSCEDKVRDLIRSIVRARDNDWL